MEVEVKLYRSDEEAKIIDRIKDAYRDYPGRIVNMMLGQGEPTSAKYRYNLFIVLRPENGRNENVLEI